MQQLEIGFRENDAGLTSVFMRSGYLSRKARQRQDGRGHSARRWRSLVRRWHEEEENRLTWGPGVSAKHGGVGLSESERRREETTRQCGLLLH